MQASRLCGYGSSNFRNFLRLLNGVNRLSSATVERIANGLKLSDEERERLVIELDENGFYCVKRGRSMATRDRTEKWLDRTKPSWTPMNDKAKWYLETLGRPLD